jgi:LPXTG-motif cell wall-anchored protein
MRRAVVCGAALGVVGLGLSSVAQAAGEARVEAEVQCDATGHGVLDLTLVNDGGVAARFEVLAPSASGVTQVLVGPGDAYAVTVTGLVDGEVAVLVAIDGTTTHLTRSVACALPEVQSGGPTGQSGVAGAHELPRTGASTGLTVVAGVLVGCGALGTVLGRRRPATR